MRSVHFALLGIIAAIALIGGLEVRPALQDFDPARHATYKDTWAQRSHISYWEKWGSFERDACQAMVDDFNQHQDKVFTHYINTSQVNRKAMLAIVGNDPPDVVGLWANDLPPFAEAGALMPLDDLMAKSGLTRDYYTDNYLKLGEYDGKIYALPTTPASVALFYNKQHFRRKAAELRAAGLDPDRPPRTIEELDRYAAVLNEFNRDGSPKVMGFLPTEPGWFNFTWGYYFGGTLYDDATDTITADAPGNIAAYKWFKRYAEAYGRESLLRFRSGFGNFDSPLNAFIEGNVSMEMQGVWFPNFIRRHRPHMEFGVAPFPTAEGVPGPMSELDADIIAIPRGCKHPEAAWQFVLHTQTRGLAILCRLHGKHMPVRNPPPLYRQGHPNLELDVFEEVAASPHSFILPRISIWQEYQNELNRAFEHVWSWPVPESKIAGLTGSARQAKIDQLCEAEIRKTLATVRETMQKKLDAKRQRDTMRRGLASRRGTRRVPGAEHEDGGRQ
ncbi:MAG TPA: ABC transporter substrate-binding protein [Planctomycetota bacterium]|nr:ABC transporter substrate-binding protein [Planctomycetota bacterium]